MKNLITLNIPGDTDLEGIEGMPDKGFTSLRELITWGMTMLMIGASLLCLMLLILGGIQWITSGGDKAGIEAARNRIIYAIIGLIIIFSSFLIIRTVSGLFGIELLRFPS